MAGSGTLEIKDGNISVGADNRILNTYSSIDKYDTFEGKIDNNGSVLASITFDACYGEGGCGEKKITLEGDIDARQLTGMYGDIKIVFELGKGIGEALLRRLGKCTLEMKGGGLEWAVLDWNDPAISFYKKMGAVPLNEWTTFRVAGEKLKELAAL